MQVRPVFSGLGSDTREPTPPAPDPAEPTPTEPPAPVEEDVPTEDPAAEDIEAEVEGDADEHDEASAPPVRGKEKVTICHRTNSRTNPYDQVVVTQESAINGHAAHGGPSFAPGVDDWGDIIAPIRPGLPRGRNWPEGRAILENGCEVQPDVGPVPNAVEEQVECTGTGPAWTSGW